MALPQHGIATSLTGYLKATMAGGLLFLLPLILIVIALRRATELAGKVVKPISDSCLLRQWSACGARRSSQCWC